MIKEKLLTLPKKPGCYLMKDKEGTIIYVGKAINLYNRVNSYFRGAHDYKTTKLVSSIVDFDYIVTKSEKEALILEYNLIKQYDPYFNIVFKDDKSYPYILLSDSPEPYVSIIRLKKNQKVKGRLFGPFPDVGAARNTLDILNKLYPTRKCERMQDSLCLYYHIKSCLGYCEIEADKNECENIKNRITGFLKGETAETLKDLKTRMNEASENLNFEEALKYRDLINDINNVTSKQDVQINSKEDFDVFSYAVEDGYISITGLFIRNGKLLSSNRFIDYLICDAPNFVSSYIYQYYEINPKPKNLFVDNDILVYLDGAIEDLNVNTVSRGKKYQLLKQARLNSEEYLKQNRKIVTRKEDYSRNLEEEFKRIFKSDIKRIELFDNSHTGGVNTVAAMVVYKDFKPSKKDYRLFKLEEGADDLKSMKEVMYRRYFRVLSENLERPDLIIVDGARIQIEAAKEILTSLDLDITLCGLGKDDHHNTAYLMDAELNKIDIDPDSNLFFFLASMQDEVHRFAINYHKKLRQKNMYRSKLDGIEGLGEKSRLKLLRKYKTITNISRQSVEELSTVLPLKVAERLYNSLRENKNDTEPE
ncbi:MAG: excinuclease ABC subunit UvrC [Solobacterium sp.]|nr:excinuclease ABC subunit UvrC [Solobacterium sp.]MDD5983412.1 excinuclease ABC subunit UvrC [Solobacterium sp.]MDD6885920.1 excinuclease ABC subunit UvrC [Solobacterium sp.]MDY4641546.1 excinuclease ABC subunit UvrC [Erysipelotrichaceae bacterium]MDY5652786.1 excinuclease ABC subunit UvrC [Erysipelotrichaceae bacterium]